MGFSFDISCKKTVLLNCIHLYYSIFWHRMWVSVFRHSSHFLSNWIEITITYIHTPFNVIHPRRRQKSQDTVKFLWQTNMGIKPFLYGWGAKSNDKHQRWCGDPFHKVPFFIQPHSSLTILTYYQHFPIQPSSNHPKFKYSFHRNKKI